MTEVNRRFGSYNTFGTVSTFGASSGAERNLTVALEVDWFGTGFTGYNEANGRIISFDERRGRENLINSGGDGFEAASPGEISIVLKNEDRRYDPFYQAGTLYNYLYSNQKLRLKVRDETTGTVYTDFTGYIDDIRPNYGAIKTVTITAKDGLKKLKDVNISSGTVYTTVQYDDQIVNALTAAGWADGTSIDTAVSDTLNYHWFSGNSAFSEIDQLTQAAFGIFFVNAGGSAVYKSHISSDTSVMTLTDDDIDYEYGIRSPTPREVVRNKVTVYARARSAQTGVELWRMLDVPQIATGTASPIWASYSYNGESVPATSITEPVAGTANDYAAFANADGSGSNLTANFSFTRTGFATSSKLIPVNTGAAGYLTLLKIRGNCIAADQYTYAQDSDSDSITAYGERELVIKTDWLQDVNTAINQASFLLERFKNPRYFPRVKIKRGSIAKMYTADLFDLVTLNFTSIEFSAEMRLSYIERSWNISEPNVMDATFYFEPNLTVSSSGSWIFPTTFPATFA